MTKSVILVSVWLTEVEKASLSSRLFKDRLFCQVLKTCLSEKITRNKQGRQSTVTYKAEGTGGGVEGTNLGAVMELLSRIICL